MEIEFTKMLKRSLNEDLVLPENYRGSVIRYYSILLNSI